MPHADGLQQIAFHYKAQYKNIFIVLAATLAQKVHLTILLSDGFLKGSNAHDMMQSIAPLIGGKGGGQPFWATAKGDQPEGIALALKAARRLFIMPHR
jgi:alanyl-tRNA synthetase